MGDEFSIHVECAKAYFDTKDVLERVRNLTPSITDADAAEITWLLDAERPAAPKADDSASEGGRGDRERREVNRPSRDCKYFRRAEPRGEAPNIASHICYAQSPEQFGSSFRCMRLLCLK